MLVEDLVLHEVEMAQTRKYLFAYCTVFKNLVHKLHCTAKFFRSDAGVHAALQILKSNVLQFLLNVTEFN